MNGGSGLSSGKAVLDGPVCRGWWLVDDEGGGPTRIVAGPFPDRIAASWAARATPAAEPAACARPLYGIRGPDGVLNRRPSPEDCRWLAHLGEQLDRLPAGWENHLSDDDPLDTLVVEVTAALLEGGLPLHDATGPGAGLGGACVVPEPALDGIVITWRQHDRMSVDQAHGAAADTAVQQVLNRALADVLLVRGFTVEPFGDGTAHVVHRAGTAAAG